MLDAQHPDETDYLDDWSDPDAPMAPDPELFNPVLRHAVQHWQITAVGRRPVDYLRRDLLLGSMLRDERPKLFHKSWKHPYPWLQAMVEHLPEADRPQALQFVSLHLRHRKGLARLLGKNADPTAPDYFRMRSLWRCRPVGYALKWVGSAPVGDKGGKFLMAPGRAPWERHPQEMCNRAWLCPWCLTRKVVALHDRLRAGPLRNAGGSYLVQARVVVPDVAIKIDDAYMQRLFAKFDGNFNWWWFQDRQSINFHHTLGLGEHNRLRFVREQLGRELVEMAGTLGVTGGLVAYQAGPHLNSTTSARCFRHELTLLGVVSGSPATVEKRFGRYYGIGHHATCLAEPAIVHWAALPAEHAHALRFFLAGSSVRYQLDRLPLIAHANTRYLMRFGIPGVFRAQPLFMFDDVQWRNHAYATKGLHLYRLFGSWAGALPAAEPPDLLATEADLAAMLKRGPLAKANRAKQADTRSRREGWLAHARPLWAQLTASQHGKRGRPALREPLRALLLAEQGIVVGANDLKWLVTTLTQEAKAKVEAEKAQAVSA